MCISQNQRETVLSSTGNYYQNFPKAGCCLRLFFRVLILCPPSKEKLLIDHKLYLDIPAETENDDLEEDEEVEEEGLKEVVGQ